MSCDVVTPPPGLVELLLEELVCLLELDELVGPVVGLDVRLGGTLTPGQGGGQKLRVLAGPECVVPLMTVGSVRFIAGGTTLGTG